MRWEKKNIDIPMSDWVEVYQSIGGQSVQCVNIKIN